MAQRPRGRLPRHARPLAADLRRVRRRRRGQRALPCPRRRRRSPHDGASRDQRVDVHDTRQLEPRARDRRCALRDRALLLGGDAGRACRASTCSRPCRASTSRGSSATRPVAEVTARRSSSSALIALAVWIRANVAEFRQRVRQAFTVVRTPARWLRTVVAWQLADWALRLATVWFMLDAFRIEQSAAQRAARAGGAEPRDARADQPGRDRDTAGAPRLHAPRAGVALGAARLQRRHEADPHRRQRRRSASRRSCSRCARCASARLPDPAAGDGRP